MAVIFPAISSLVGCGTSLGVFGRSAFYAISVGTYGLPCPALGFCSN
ncbi:MULTISPECIES: hypothetical protein [unclassified Microcoleus]